MPESLPAGCPIRKSAGQWVFAPLRGLSQLVTSFVASESQGIPHAPLVTFRYKFSEDFRLQRVGFVYLPFLPLFLSGRWRSLLWFEFSTLCLLASNNSQFMIHNA